MAVTYRYPKVFPLTYAFAFNTASIGSGVAIGVIPAGAIIASAQTAVATAFNAGGTDLLNIGISAGGIEICNAEDISTIGVKAHYAFQSLNPLAATRTIYVRYTQAGAAATTGAAFVTILWKLG